MAELITYLRTLEDRLVVAALQDAAAAREARHLAERLLAGGEPDAALLAGAREGLKKLPQVLAQDVSDAIDWYERLTGDAGAWLRRETVELRTASASLRGAVLNLRNCTARLEQHTRAQVTFVRERMAPVAEKLEAAMADAAQRGTEETRALLGQLAIGLGVRGVSPIPPPPRRYPLVSYLDSQEADDLTAYLRGIADQIDRPSQTP